MLSLTLTMLTLLTLTVTVRVTLTLLLTNPTNPSNRYHCEYGTLSSMFSYVYALYKSALTLTLTSTFVKQNWQDAQLSQRDRAAGCVIVFAKSRRLDWETIFYGQYRSIFNQCDIIGRKICRILWKKRKIRAITAFKVIQGHRGRFQSKACMRFPSD